MEKKCFLHDEKICCVRIFFKPQEHDLIFPTQSTRASGTASAVFESTLSVGNPKIFHFIHPNEKPYWQYCSIDLVIFLMKKSKIFLIFFRKISENIFQNDFSPRKKKVRKKIGPLFRCKISFLIDWAWFRSDPSNPAGKARGRVQNLLIFAVIGVYTIGSSHRVL